MDTIFDQIIAKKIPADIVYEDELCLVFKDINPQAPCHLLLIPKEKIKDLAQLQKGHKDLLGHMMLVVQKVAKEQDFSKGFRVVTNTGSDGGQEVSHLHFHILAGRKMTWPPG